MSVEYHYLNPLGKLSEVTPICKARLGRMILCKEHSTDELLMINEDLLITIHDEDAPKLHCECQQGS